MAGRPRSSEVDAAIIGAALEALREVGYSGLTLDAVAHRAGVGKSSLYLRYRSAAELAVAAVASVPSELPPVRGEVRADLVAYLHAVQRDLGRLGIEVIGSLLGESTAALDAHRTQVIGPRARHSREILRAAQDRGEIRADADVDMVMELLFGSLLAAALVGERPNRSWPEDAVDAVLQGIRPERGQVRRPSRKTTPA